MSELDLKKINMSLDRALDRFLKDEHNMLILETNSELDLKNVFGVGYRLNW